MNKKITEAWGGWELDLLMMEGFSKNYWKEEQIVFKLRMEAKR